MRDEDNDDGTDGGRNRGQRRRTDGTNGQRKTMTTGRTTNGGRTDEGQTEDDGTDDALTDRGRFSRHKSLVIDTIRQNQSTLIITNQQH